MGELAGSDLMVFFLGLAVLLSGAHLLGEAARRIGQPMVIGEMAAGLLLGPACLGWIAPDLQVWLFPHEGPAATALDSVVALAVALLLLLAGMEIDLSGVWRQGKSAAWITAGSVLTPMAAGTALAWAAPDWWGMPPDAAPGLFAVFFGAALAVSALPVIAKILLDLDLFHSDFGVMVLVVATVNNLVAWLVFSVVLGGETGALVLTAALTVTFAAVMLTAGRWMADRSLLWVQAHLTWPGGVLGLAIVSGLLGAAITEAIGIHAIFGAFLAGIALGDSPHMREHTRHIVHRFVEGILAPIFVAAMGLEVNFIANFYPGLVLRVVLLGIVVKVLGTWLGARMGGRQSVEAWGTGWALNARGEVGIVLGLLAWQNGIIGERLFVALVTLALATSAMAGPMLKRLLQCGRTWTFGTLLDTRSCVTDLPAENSQKAIGALAAIAAERASLDARHVTHAVLAREMMMGTGLGRGVAIPHARLREISAPIVTVATTHAGIAFDGIDNEPVRLIFLVLTPESDPTVQLQILAAIAKMVDDPKLREEAISAATPTALLGALRVADVLHKEVPAARPPSAPATEGENSRSRSMPI